MVQENKKAVKTGGDDLDDGLDYDQDLLADSDAEDVASAAGSEMGDEQEAVPIEGAPQYVIEGEETEISMSPVIEGKKRKLEEVETVGAPAAADDEQAKAADKKRRKKEKEKERKQKKRQNVDKASGASSTPTHLAKEDLSAILLRSIRESYPSGTAMEIEDIIIPQDNILPPPSYPAPALDPSNPFKPLQQKLDALIENKKAPKSNGTPKVIILALSGLRCADVVRGVRDVKGEGEVVKLFAKHFKLTDQINHLARTKVSIAVGTPARVGKLLAEGALKITKHTTLLLDISHQDSKTRTILTLPEVRDELWKSVFGGEGRKKLLENGAKVGAF
ncbi:hypothetical protein IAR50_007063 [Cryptococcus sp. DSM 104548]